MRPTRRDLLRGGAVLLGARALPIAVRGGPAYADVPPAATGRRRLVVVFLAGGNDGLNTIVPVGNVAGGARRDVYERLRPTLAVPLANVLPLTRTAADAEHGVGLNDRLPALHALYQAGRLAVVQGVDYPGHSYSHFSSTDFWQSGQPQQTVTSGWLGRHLDRAGIADGELRAVAVDRDLPLLFAGEESAGRARSAAAFASFGAVRFADGLDSDPEYAARHEMLASYDGYPATDTERAYYGATSRQACDLVRRVAAVSAPPVTPSYFTSAMLVARTMLEADLGVELVSVVQYGGYDTHSDQSGQHTTLLATLDEGIEAFFHGTRRGEAIPGAGAMDPAVAAETLVVTYSEFGRTIGENGSGTDHGAAGPMFVIGPPPPAAGSGAVALVPGIHGEHPDMGTQTLTSDDLAMTTDVRRVYRALLNGWLGDDDPYYAGLVDPLPLFRTA